MAGGSHAGFCADASPVGCSRPVNNTSVGVGRRFDQTGGTYWTNVGGTPLKDGYDSSAAGGIGGGTILGTESGATRSLGNKTGNIDFINPGSGFAGVRFGVRDGARSSRSIRSHPSDVNYGRRDYFDIEHPTGCHRVQPENVRRRRSIRSRLVPPKHAVFCIPPNKDLLAYWGRVRGPAVQDPQLHGYRWCSPAHGAVRAGD